MTAWMSTDEAADHIGGVSSRWVRKQVEMGRLRARVLKTGSRCTYRIRDADIQAFLAGFVIDDSREGNR